MTEKQLHVVNASEWKMSDKQLHVVNASEWKMSDMSEPDCKRRVSDLQRRCSLHKERLKDAHSHPGQWKSELQQFLLTTQRYRWARVYASPA